MNEFELLRLMQRYGCLQPPELADKLGVGTRTVRTYIQRLNIMLDGSASIAYRHGKGYVLTITDEAAYATALDTIRGHLTPASNSTTRVQYLMGDLLSRSDWITLDDLSRVLFVSRATISNELKQVETALDSFGLVLERRPHRGIRVVGPELQRRLCLANVAAAHGGGFIADGDVRKRLEAITGIIEKVATDAGVEISSVVYQNLVIHILVALFRIEDGCYVPMSTEQLESIRRGFSYEVAQTMATHLAECFGMELPEQEIAYIAIHLDGKRMLSDADVSDGLGESVITDEVWRVVSDMLETVWETYHFDLRGDLELRMNLARHIVPLSVRLRYGMGMENPLLEDIKVKYAFAYSMAADSAPVLSDAFGGELSEAEIGYIALAYALAIERTRTEPEKKNILVACASGMGSAHLLEYRIRKMFGDQLGSVETCDAGRVAAADFSRIDYVFTTVPLPERVPVPVCRIPFFFDESDVSEVAAILKGEKEKSVRKFFSPQLFRSHFAASSRREALHALCSDLHEAGLVPAEYEDLVFQRERAMSTSFGGLTALPHAIRACGERSVVNVALLDEPVDWGGQPVQVVLLISFSSDPEPELFTFYQVVAQLFSRQATIRDLLESRNFDHFMSVLESIEMELADGAQH